jgi:hypothetical protein
VRRTRPSSTWAAATVCSRISPRRARARLRIEVEDDKVIASVTNGINVIQADLERGLWGKTAPSTVLLS